MVGSLILRLADWANKKENSAAAKDIAKGSEVRAIYYAPVFIMLLCWAFIYIPATRSTTLWMFQENHPIEILTFAAAIAGATVGTVLAWRAMKLRERPLVFSFYALLSLALFFIGMEEVSWGQQFMGFDTPSAWRVLNLQGETTLHNVSGLQGRSEIFRLLFGLGGLAGVWLNRRYPYLRKIGMPAVLLPWFAVISLHSGVDLYNDYFPIAPRFDFYVHETSELNEMLIAFSGLLYFALNSKLHPIMMKDRRVT